VNSDGWPDPTQEDRFGRPTFAASRGGRGRLHLLQLGAVGILLLMLVPMTWQMVADPTRPERLPDSRAPRVIAEEAPRGLIYDRDGVVIADNVPQFALTIVPAELPDGPEELREYLLALERRSGSTFASLEGAVRRGLASVDPEAPVVVRAGFDREEAIAVRAATAGMPGVDIVATPVRTYGGGAAFAHILGYVSSIPPDEVEDYLEAGYPYNGVAGLTGLELVYEDVLRGTPAKRLILVDPAGHETDAVSAIASAPGSNLHLSISLDLQRKVASALANGIDAGLASVRPEFRDEREEPLPVGAAVVLDVRTGEVKALVSLPSYDANLFAGVVDDEELTALLNDPSRPLIDRAVDEARSPGSTFKPLVALAALEEGVATPDTRITSTGAISVQDEFNPEVFYVFRDWTVHGSLDLYGGIARSSDVYFYYLSGGYTAPGSDDTFEGLGIERLATYARGAGLGQPTEIDLPGEATGLVPDSAWKSEALGEPWVLGDTYTFGIGQGFLTTTPLQMAVLTSAIANGGELLAPRLVSAIDRGNGAEPTERTVTGLLPVSSSAISVVQRAMREAVLGNGTARAGQPEGLRIAGKTGTAEWGPPYPDGEFDTHGWYIGYGPYEDPEIAVVVYLQQGVGSEHAAPTARAIFEAYFGLDEALVADQGGSE
jgi:penicillin-binding protein 2